MNTTAQPNTCHDELPTALIKQMAQDFRVDEVLGFEPEGEGEHLWLQFRKTSRNTRDIIEELAKALSLPERDIGCSGLKDKHAVTTQWLSLPTARAANKEDLPQLIDKYFCGTDALELLVQKYGRKKLKTGTHKANQFTLVLRDISAAQELIDERLTSIVKNGFPNYFGEQRFGRDGRNLAQAKRLFEGRLKASRFKRGMYLSAARAHLFNRVLAQRVTDGSWNTILNGEACMLDGSSSVFVSEVTDAAIESRCQSFDIHPTGPLWGSGQPMVSDALEQFEAAIVEHDAILAEGLVKAGLRAERRALRAVAGNLQWQWQDPATLELEFSLQRGVFATALLAEVVNVENAESQRHGQIQ